MILKAAVYFEGLNIQREVNNLLKQGCLLCDLTKEDARRACVTVRVREVKKVVAYLKEKCYNVTNIKYLGLSRPFALAFSRPALLICIVVLLAALIFLSDRCLVIRVKSGEYRQEVLQGLTHCGVGMGTNLKTLDIDALENKLCILLDCSYAIISREGSTLLVEVIPRVEAQKPVDFDKGFDIVALGDGVVTRIVTLSGTPLVKVGDKVKKGQVLIKGVRTFKDGSTQPVRAVGEVYATAAVEAVRSLEELRWVYERTDKSVTLTDLVLAKKTVSSTRKIPFETYETDYSYFSLFPLGIKVITRKVYQTVLTYKDVSMEEGREVLIAKLKEDIKILAYFKIDYIEYITQGDSIKAVAYGEVLLSA